MASFIQSQFLILSFFCLLTSGLPHAKHVSNRNRERAGNLHRTNRGDGDVSLKLDGKLQCDQGKLIGAAQIGGKIYLGCSYFHTTEYYWVGVIKTFDAATLQQTGSTFELELPENHVMDKLVGSPARNVLYMVTYAAGEVFKSIWTISFPNDQDFDVGFFLLRSAKLSGIKVTSDGKLVLNELDTIYVYDGTTGSVLSETDNSLHEQGMLPSEVLLLPSGSFLVSHDKKDNFAEYDISELSPDGEVVRSYSSSATKDSPKITSGNSLVLLNSDSILLLNRNFDSSVPDAILQIKTDLSSGKVIASGSANGIDKLGTGMSFDPTTGKLLVAFPNNRNQPVVHAFKVSS